jgi:hypothetical protein
MTRDFSANSLPTESPERLLLEGSFARPSNVASSEIVVRSVGRSRCLFPEPPPPGTVPACAEAGVMGALGSMMALEAIREIVGFGEGLVGKLLMLDARAMRFETLRYRRDPANPLHGDAPVTPILAGIADLTIAGLTIANLKMLARASRCPCA